MTIIVNGRDFVGGDKVCYHLEGVECGCMVC